MTYVRALDSNGDWTWGLGKNNYLVANYAVGQNIKTSLLSFLGDCFFAPTDGLDWFTLLGQNHDSGLGLQLAVNAVVLSVPDVLKLNTISVNLNRNTRQMSLNYTVQTTYSQLSGILTYAFPVVG